MDDSRQDIALFAKNVLDIELNEMQLNLVKEYEHNRDILFTAPRKSGKTTVGAIIMYYRLLNHKTENSILTSTNLIMSSNIFEVIREWATALPKETIKLNNHRKLELINGNSISVVSAHYPSAAVRGKPITFVFYDEPTYSLKSAQDFMAELSPLYLRKASVLLVSSEFVPDVNELVGFKRISYAE